MGDLGAPRGARASLREALVSVARRRLVHRQEDVTGKTDYDVIGGTDSALRMVQTGGGEPVTIAEAKDLKGVTLRWSDDGRTFAYAKKGEVFVQRVDEKQPRSLTPPPAKEGEKPGTEPANDVPGDASKDTKPKDEPESFSVGPFARDGKRLLITSKKGWYVDVQRRRGPVLTLKEGVRTPHRGGWSGARTGSRST
jgi:hypothetical protein